MPKMVEKVHTIVQYHDALLDSTNIQGNIRFKLRVFVHVHQLNIGMECDIEKHW